MLEHDEQPWQQGRRNRSTGYMAIPLGFIGATRAQAQKRPDIAARSSGACVSVGRLLLHRLECRKGLPTPVPPSNGRRGEVRQRP